MDIFLPLTMKEDAPCGHYLSVDLGKLTARVWCADDGQPAGVAQEDIREGASVRMNVRTGAVTIDRDRAETK